MFALKRIVMRNMGISKNIRFSRLNSAICPLARKFFSSQAPSKTRIPFDVLLQNAEIRKIDDDAKYADTLRLKKKKEEELIAVGEERVAVGKERVAVKIEIAAVKMKIVAVEKEIAAMKEKIVGVEQNLKEKALDGDLRYYREMLLLLTTEKNILTAKEDNLTTKEKDLTTKEDNLPNKVNKIMDDIEKLANLLSKDVRSLFKDYPKMELAVNSEPLLLNIGKVKNETINLTFVNRKNELIEAWNKCVFNIDQPDKHNLLVCGQMFGSGKTTFGKQLFNFKNPYIKSLFNENCESLLLSKTLPVFIHIPDFDSKDIIKNTNDLVSCSIFASTLNQYFNIDINIAKLFWQANRPDVSNCTSLLLSITGRCLFFHFDEVKELPEMLLRSNATEKAKEQIFYKFWLSVVQAQKQGCFAYVCSRSQTLNFFGTYGGLKGSVGQAVHLRLSVFKAEDITDILSGYSDPSSIGARLKIETDEQLKQIADWLHITTSGIPRYVEHVLRDMISQTDITKHLIEWDTPKSVEMMMKLTKVQDLMPDYKNLCETEMGQVRLLVELAMKKEELVDGQRIGRTNITNLILLYGFFTEAVLDNNGKDTGRFRIIIPKIWEYSTFLDQLSVQYPHRPTIDVAKGLEDHVAHALVYWSRDLQQQTTKTVSKVIPFLSKTFIANEVHPELHNIEMTDKALEANRQQVFENDVNISSPGCLLVRPVNKASLPDLITLLPITNGGRYVIGWQMKNFTTSKLGIPTIVKEIKKFTDLLKGKDGYKGGVFVIILNGKGTEIVESIRGLVINSGTQFPKIKDNNEGNGNRKGEVKARKGNKLSDITTNLPDNIELIIPTEGQLTDYLGTVPMQKCGLVEGMRSKR